VDPNTPAEEKGIDKQFEMEILIKCADTSNVLKPFPIAKKWAMRVTDEFFLQVICNILQHSALHCSTLQHRATHCNTLQCTSAHRNILQYTAKHCKTLRNPASHPSPKNGP
jgi:hypothetical protein